MTANKPRQQTPPTRRRPGNDLPGMPAIQRRMLSKIKSPKMPLAQRVGIAIALLKVPEIAPQAERMLQKLCADPGLPPATFAKVSKALTRYEAETPAKEKLSSDLIITDQRRAELIASPKFSWFLTLEDGLYEKWKAAHPE